jgi:hypothetical protein
VSLSDRLILTRKTRRAGAVTLLALIPVVGSVQACTDLTEVPSSALTPETFFRNEEEVLGALASVYAQLRQLTEGYYNLTEVSSDEYIVPTRGNDWYDNGRWLEIHRQTWTANSTASLDDMNGTWNNLFAGVTRANAVLVAIENLDFESKPVVTAELRTLRAFYYYLLQDFFGGVPIVTDIEIKQRERNSRAEVFAFLEQELNESRGVLPPSWGAGNYGRLTRGAADAILASLYLNAQVFTGEVSAGGLQPGTARWQDAVDAVDRIINSGVYSLSTNWRSNFTADNFNSPEIIMAVTYLNTPGLGLNFVMRALHYNQFDPSPWNGFATIAETYFAFDADDQRREVFLVGAQTNVETGEPVNDRSGDPLFFTPEIADPTSATESEGVRIVKWPADPDHVQENNGNDFGVFRLAEMYLIKAEALNELGQTVPAINLVNEIRARVFSPQEPLSLSLTQAEFRDAVLDERLFELISEAKRRQDLIRHGLYTSPWSFKDQREAYRILMPIPQTQLDANPLLVQNAGY